MGKTSNIILVLIFKDLITFACLPSANFSLRQSKDLSEENGLNDYGRIISLFSITVLALTWIIISAISWGFYFALRNPARNMTTLGIRDPNLQSETIPLAKPISINYKQLEKDSENPQIRKEEATMLSANGGYGSANYETKNLQIKKEGGNIIRLNDGAPNFLSSVDESYNQKPCCCGNPEENVTNNKDPIYKIVNVGGSDIRTGTTSETKSMSNENQCWCCRKQNFESYDSRFTGTSTITPNNVELLKSTPQQKYVVRDDRDRQILSSTEIVPQVQDMQPVAIEKNPILRPVSVTIAEEPKCKAIRIDNRKSSLVNNDKADVIYYSPPYEIHPPPTPESSFINLPPVYRPPPPPPPTPLFQKTDIGKVNQPQREPPSILIPASSKTLPRDSRDTAFGSTRNVRGCYVCSSPTRRKTEGLIHPIIESYKVQGHLRVKGKNNSDTISFMEDDYDVLR